MIVEQSITKIHIRRRELIPKKSISNPSNGYFKKFHIRSHQSQIIIDTTSGNKPEAIKFENTREIDKNKHNRHLRAGQPTGSMSLVD